MEASIKYTCHRCGDSIDHYGLCQSCSEWLAEYHNESSNLDPICEFKDQEELDVCLEWWKQKLFLMDWVISASIIPMKDFEMEDSVGENLMVFDNKEAVIHIVPKDDFPNDAVTKFCQEKVLVHELLHCLYNFMQPPANSYEGKYLDTMEHQRLDMMAKSLIMVKYGLDFSWFKNDKTKTDAS